MLSESEKAAMLADASNSKRKDVLRRFKRKSLQLSPDEFLRALQSATELFDGYQAPRRRRPRLDSSTFKL